MFRKKWYMVALVCLCVLLIAVVLSLCVAIDSNLEMAGGGVCVSFDKWNLMRSDKIVLEVSGEVYTITDEDLIRSISKESVAGTYSDYCCAHSPDGWMEIYRGDCLLRRMDYVSNHGALAYDADITHWVFFGEKGHAFLSNETRQKLETIIGYRGGP